MSALANDVQGDYDLRGLRARGYDLMFAPDELSDSAITAASRSQARFKSPFPAWQLYRALVNGTRSYEVDLVKYATGVGLAMMLARRPDGRPLARAPGVWMVSAAQDAMARTMAGSYPSAASWRADEYKVPRRTYSRIRDAIAQQFLEAVEDFQAILHYEAERVLRFDRQLP